MRRLRQSVNKILRQLKCHDRELSLLLVDDREIREINKKYLNRDYPTNVIAFPQWEGKFAYLNPQIMGDVVISVERALTDAREGDLTLEDELDFLAIHGILHLIGYNHEDASDPEIIEMQTKSIELFTLLRGYPIELRS